MFTQEKAFFWYIYVKHLKKRRIGNKEKRESKQELVGWEKIRQKGNTERGTKERRGNKLKNKQNRGIGRRSRYRKTSEGTEKKRGTSHELYGWEKVKILNEKSRTRNEARMNLT